LISVIIPAHDEGRSIARCLSVLLDGSLPGELEVVVVCNGCTDDTEGVARSFGPPVIVLVTTDASKSHALNLGDGAASGFPRFYLDADVELSIDSVRAVAAAFRPGEVLAAAPGLAMDVSNSSAAVRAYYRIWTRLPSVRTDLVGRGVYAVSAEGRQRFDAFPEVIADDHFIRTTFPPEARATVPSCSSRVRATSTFRALVRRNVRVHAGNRQVDRAGQSALRRNGWVDIVRTDPRRAGDTVVYLVATAAAKAGAWWATRNGQLPAWGRDDSRIADTGSGRSGLPTIERPRTAG